MTKQKNGRVQLHEYVVTVTSDRFIVVQAPNKTEAKARALKIARSQPTSGTDPRITEPPERTDR
jgi:hypothetical protein